jgi:lysine N6-hydroxylase
MHEVIGIGAGMFNLGLAALLDDAGIGDFLLLDRKDRFRWHDGISTDVSYYQDDHLSDLVTLANPRSRYTFLAYLKQRKLLYQFATRLASPVLRVVWEDYFRWAAEQLGRVRWNQEVRAITYLDNCFEVRTADQVYLARHLSVGIGIEPFVPPALSRVDDPRVYHSSRYSAPPRDRRGKTVCVVGASQSGAEIVDDLLTGGEIGNLVWISPEPYHMSKDPALFLFDIWNPTILREAYALGPEARARLTASMRSTQNSISMVTMASVYARLFDRKFYAEPGFDPVIVCNNRVAEIQPGADGVEVVTDDESTGKRYRFRADEVVLATGYCRTHESLLDGLRAQHPFSLQDLNFDHSVQWSGSGHNNIYLRNHGESRFGIMESNAFIQPFISSLIVNSIAGRKIYDEYPDSSIQKYSADLAKYEDRRRA